jgi:hypothetical protein
MSLHKCKHIILSPCMRASKTQWLQPITVFLLSLTIIINLYLCINTAEPIQLLVLASLILPFLCIWYHAPGSQHDPTPDSLPVIHNSKCPTFSLAAVEPLLLSSQPLRSTSTFDSMCRRHFSSRRG